MRTKLLVILLAASLVVPCVPAQVQAAEFSDLLGVRDRFASHAPSADRGPQALTPASHVQPGTVVLEGLNRCHIPGRSRLVITGMRRIGIPFCTTS